MIGDKIFYKALFSTFILFLLNGLGLVLFTTQTGFFKCIGYFNYVITFLFGFFIIDKYMRSPFYKKLGAKQ
jgi:hypothetical protein